MREPRRGFPAEPATERRPKLSRRNTSLGAALLGTALFLACGGEEIDEFEETTEDVPPPTVTAPIAGDTMGGDTVPGDTVGTAP